jgi:DNA-binding PadR family transcriptional regulator
MSASRLLVLGVIRTQGQAHGYWVYRELLNWRIETWANVQPGSIYHALKQLEKRASIVALNVENSEEGPSRTIYKVTPQGEIEFHRLLEEALTSIDMHYFGAAIAFINALPRERVLELVQRRLQELEKTREELIAMDQNYSKVDQPPQHNILFSQWITFFDSAIVWTRDLIAQLAAK